MLAAMFTMLLERGDGWSRIYSPRQQGSLIGVEVGCPPVWGRLHVVLQGWRGAASESHEVVDVSGDGGVMKRVIRPAFGYKVEVPPKHAYCKIAFSMKTSDGKLIADRMDKPMEFMLGLERPEVIPGWELAIATMKPNEVAEITCSPAYAFGAEGYGDRIPPGATIVTKLKLLSWRTLKSAGSTDIQDTHELSKKWRRELEEGTSPMTGWASPPTKKQSKVKPSPEPPLAGTEVPDKPDSPLFEEMDDADKPKPKVDLEEAAAAKKLNPNQIVLGTAPEYKWKEKQDWLELVVPVPEETRREDVLFHLTPRELRVGFKKRGPDAEETWVVGGELFGPVEVGESFWVLSKEENDELTEGQLCLEVRLEKKDPLRRIWANVFKES